MFSGAYDDARPTLLEALALYFSLGDLAGIGDTIDGLAHCANANGDSRRAVVLWGAGDALRERCGFDVQPMERRLRASAQPNAEAHLGAIEFAAAWEEGRSLTVDEIIEVAGAPDAQT